MYRLSDLLADWLRDYCETEGILAKIAVVLIPFVVFATLTLVITQLWIVYVSDPVAIKSLSHIVKRIGEMFACIIGFLGTALCWRWLWDRRIFGEW